MGWIVKLLVTIASLAALLWQAPAQATYFGFPKALKPELERIQLASPGPAPIAHLLLCPAEQMDRELALVSRAVEPAEIGREETREVDTSLMHEIIPGPAAQHGMPEVVQTPGSLLIVLPG